MAIVKASKSKKISSETNPKNQTPLKKDGSTFREIFDQLKNLSEYDINTGYIFKTEQENWNNREDFAFKKFPKKLAFSSKQSFVI